MKIRYNAPVTLTFAITSFFIFFLDEVVFKNIDFTEYLFAVAGRLEFSFVSPLSIFTLFSHVLGHGSWSHLIGNLSFLLLLGPIAEEKLGSFKFFMMILITAVVTGVINAICFDTGLMGASGIVFMLIIYLSIANISNDEIPLSFIFVVALYLGGQLIQIWENNSVSAFAHLTGGVIGGIFGLIDNTSVKKTPVQDKKINSKKKRDKNTKEGEFVDVDINEI